MNKFDILEHLNGITMGMCMLDLRKSYGFPGKTLEQKRAKELLEYLARTAFDVSIKASEFFGTNMYFLANSVHIIGVEKPLTYIAFRRIFSHKDLQGFLDKFEEKDFLDLKKEFGNKLW